MLILNRITRLPRLPSFQISRADQDSSSEEEWSWQRYRVRVGSRTTLPPRSPGRFTSVFGMGTGPSSQLWPPTPLTAGLRKRLVKPSRKLIAERRPARRRVPILSFLLL